MNRATHVGHRGRPTTEVADTPRVVVAGSAGGGPFNDRADSGLLGILDSGVRHLGWGEHHQDAQRLGDVGETVFGAPIDGHDAAGTNRAVDSIDAQGRPYRSARSTPRPPGAGAGGLRHRPEVDKCPSKSPADG